MICETSYNWEDLLISSIERVISWQKDALYNKAKAITDREIVYTNGYEGLFLTFYYASNYNTPVWYRDNAGIYRNSERKHEKIEDNTLFVYFPGFDWTEEKIKNKLSFAFKKMKEYESLQKIKEDF